MLEAACILLAAMVADALLGDPRCPLHPVRLVGRAISFAERVLRSLRLSGIVGGAVLALAVPGAFVAAYLAGRHGLGRVDQWAVLAIDAFALWSCIGLKDLVRHTVPVAAALEAGDLPAARARVQMIVSRDASVLDEAGVGRAAVESVAENFVDAALAPLFWFATGAAASHFAGAGWIPPAAAGCAAALAHRAVNTLDAMVGYRSEHYERFGKASARLDDVLNFVPARLSAIFLFGAAMVLRSRPFAGLGAFFRHRLAHTSPNSAHAESFIAGALGVRLGGPSVYAHGTVEKPWLGTGPVGAGAAEVRRSCRLVWWAGWLAAFAAVGVSVALADAGDFVRLCH